MGEATTTRWADFPQCQASCLWKPPRHSVLESPDLWLAKDITGNGYIRVWRSRQAGIFKMTLSLLLQDLWVCRWCKTCSVLKYMLYPPCTHYPMFVNDENACLLTYSRYSTRCWPQMENTRVNVGLMDELSCMLGNVIRFQKMNNLPMHTPELKALHYFDSWAHSNLESATWRKHLCSREGGCWGVKQFVKILKGLQMMGCICVILHPKRAARTLSLEMVGSYWMQPAEKGGCLRLIT